MDNRKFSRANFNGWLSQQQEVRLEQYPGRIAKTICSQVPNCRRSVLSSKNKLLTDKELAAYETDRDLAAELLEAVQQMKAGQTHVVLSPVIEARKKTGLSQSQFATLLGVSVRTLQGWEQGQKQPSGAARTLLAIANTNPKAVLAAANK